ncbi:MAG: precorrin-2 dehydrogenase/sirohydrochlorin ferrochelatase family protein [Planctomycetota bacterium]|jgi:precorrin-2 dehydrogenase/sirohydrochlorin ferrochelatase
MAEHRASYFPLLVDLAGREVTVVGGGKVAERKVRTLLECGARVRVVAPSLTGGLAELATAGRIAHEDRAYEPGDLAGATVGFVAVDDPRASAAAAADARRAGVLVNVVDRPELCDFIVPSVVRRGLLSIAISTAGASPAWARRIRERLEKEFGEEYARLFDALARVRKALLAEIPDPARRRKALVRLADESLVELARSASEDEIVTELLRLAREEVGEE